MFRRHVLAACLPLTLAALAAAGEATAAGIVVRGRVYDADDGRPIARFQLVPTFDYADGRRGMWQRHLLSDHEGGRYEFRSERPWERTRFRVQAEGYRPGISRAVKQTEGEVTIDFPLKKDAGLSGLVRNTEGAPVGAARVMFATQSRQAQLSGGMLIASDSGESRRLGVAVTGPDGAFRLPPEADPGLIVAAHLRHGYAEVAPEALAGNREITLRPWGRVEGRVLAGETPLPGRLVTLSSSRPASSREFTNAPVWHGEEVTTDEAGRFAFPRIAPGRASVNRVTRTKDGFGWISVLGTGAEIEVVERGTTLVTLGGLGRAVTGQLKPPPGVARAVDWSKFTIHVSPPAPHIGFGRDDEEWAEYGRFAKSAEGRPYFPGPQPVKADGTFRLERLPQGHYDLQVRFADGDRQAFVPAGTRFDVPATADGRGDAIDLGTLPILDAALP